MFFCCDKVRMNWFNAEYFFLKTFCKMSAKQRGLL